jgi:hypothetical protein
VREELFVNEHFHLRPLLALVSAGDEYFVLQLRQTSQRLLKGNAQGLVETDPLDLRSPQGTPLGAGDLIDRRDAGPRSANANVLEADGSLQTHLGQIAAAVEQRLSGETAPLLLACDSRLASIYRAVSRYGNLHDQHIGGSHYLSLAELHTRSWPLIRPALVQNREAHRKRMLLHRDGQARHGLADIIPAALEGRIDALFIDCRAPRWGHLEPNGRVSLHARPEQGDDDLLELAVSETLRHRGQVFAVDVDTAEMDDNAEALLRF